MPAHDDLLARVFRTTITQPGYALLDLGPDVSPADLRRQIVDLGRSLAQAYQVRFGRELRFQSISRFDQQATTRPHRDGGPDGSVLLLGYEPSAVRSRLFVMDYSRAAADVGLTPAEWLARFSPTMGADESRLRPYTTELLDFAPQRNQLVLINNGCLPPGEDGFGMLGLLHHACVEATPNATRFIASVQMGLADTGLTPEQVEAFVADGTGAV